MQKIINLLPKSIQEQFNNFPKELLGKVEEIRIRINRPIEVIANQKAIFLSYIVKPQDAEQLLNKLSQHSFYMLDEELKRGYITVEGGHRIGLAGRVILEKGFVKAIRDVASFNIRVAKEKIGISEKWIPYLYQAKWKNTMIIGPPQTGKTTLLRDLARVISIGDKKCNIPPLKVGIIDERSEIAGSVGGVPQLTFGNRVDVMDSCPKAEGMMMMIRSMSPDVLVVDEIGRKEDTEAILEAVHAGICLIMTTHGDSYKDILQRPTLKPILDQKIFNRFIELSRGKGPGTVVSIKDENGKELVRRASVVT
ncbi:stage III sporulation protein AA [Pallidibacillus pasinlerensis]|uniref:Stage III sporulation protein AA n=1 Tax=Pallidibacillus pasinlerensis TaxID=2703818 RepID=A0ABX0A2Q0_9BACI|nr:stage III sporulation protein AA [Pallidibacillus pasinlerensis]NCU16791.1 stage III sporulation protein AA [Pallidibacillus pasinlerensis]